MASSRSTPIPRWAPEAGALALILCLQALLIAQGLGAAALYDEGVYLGSLDALRAGQQLGTDVFAAQPPGFYFVLRVAASVFGNDVEGVRVGILVLGLLGSLGTYVALRVTVGAAAGLLGAAFLVIAPPIPLYAMRVLSDLPALDLVLLALAAAALAGSASRAHPRWAVVAGVLTMAACSVKVSAALAAPAIVLLLVRNRRRVNLIGFGGGAAFVFAVVFLLNVRALPELRESIIDYHRQLRDFGSLERFGGPSVGQELLDPRAAFTWLVAVAVILALVHTVRDRRLRVSPFAVLACCGVALVVWHRPLFEHHLVAASVGFAVAAAEPIGRELARTAGMRRVLLAGLVVLLIAGGYVQQTRRVTTELPRDDPRLAVDIALLQERTRSGDVIVSDQPILAYRARRSMPGNVIDTSYTRFATGLLTDRELLNAVDLGCARAVVAGRSFTTRPRLLREFGRRFVVVERRPLGTFFFDRRVPCR